MRGLLLFLACAAAVAVCSPFFWSIVRMHTSAERVGYVEADGGTQWAMLGPKAPWPDWALVPDGARLQVRAHFETAPGHPATGYGDIDLAGTGAEAQAAFAAKAEADGWTVALSYYDSAEPSIPPRPVRLCFAHATKDGRTLRLTLFGDGAPSAGALHWFEGAPPPVKGAVAGAC